jgi:hypothetical protein
LHDAGRIRTQIRIPVEIMMDPDSGGPKIYGSGSTTVFKIIVKPILLLNCSALFED